MKWFSKSNLKSTKIRWMICSWRSEQLETAQHTRGACHFLAPIRSGQVPWLTPLLSRRTKALSFLTHPAQAAGLPSRRLLSALKSRSNILAPFSHPQVFLLTPRSQPCNPPPPVHSLPPGPTAFSPRWGPNASICLAHSRYSMRGGGLG